jgi:hypothetical protein
MRRTFMLGLLLALGFAAPGRATPPASTTAADTRELSAVRTVIDAVNRKDPDLYASVFTDDTVVQLHDGPVRVTGRVALRANRSAHFQRFPATRSEIVHLVQIGEKVVMHDRLWLRGEDAPTQVVEIFTFRNGFISRVEVIQDSGLTNRVNPAHSAGE